MRDKTINRESINDGRPLWWWVVLAKLICRNLINQQISRVILCQWHNTIFATMIIQILFELSYHLHHFQVIKNVSS